MRASAAFLVVLLGCAGEAPPPATPSIVEKPPPSAEDRARFDDATARCQADDDCVDLASCYEHGKGTDRDLDRARAASLKACLGGSDQACINAVWMRDDIAAPGTHLMTAAKCQGDAPEHFLCSDLGSLPADENRASPAIKTACTTLQSTAETAAPSVLGPLVDRCPGLATPQQRERARLFRSEADIARAYDTVSTGSPRQVRRVYERLAPLGDPRADKVLAVGVRRFAKPKPSAFEKKRDNVLHIPALEPQLDLCTFDGDTAILAPLETRPSAVAVVGVLVRLVAPIMFPPAWPFLFPDSPKQSVEVDEAAKKRAAEVKAQLEAATGATTMMMIGSCGDVVWFVEKSAAKAKP